MIDIEKIDAPIQIVNGHLSCPHCAGDVSVQGVAMKDGMAIPVFNCHECKEVLGVLFENDDSDSAAVSWVVIPPAGVEALAAAEAHSVAVSAPAISDDDPHEMN